MLLLKEPGMAMGPHWREGGGSIRVLHGGQDGRDGGFETNDYSQSTCALQMNAKASKTMPTSGRNFVV